MSRIIRYTNPWCEWATLNRALNRWATEAAGAQNGDQVDVPSLDVAESPEQYTIKAALPGWKPEDVDITFEKGVVTLKGEVKTEEANEKTEENAKYHFKEIRKASFYRQLSLPSEVEAEKANAAFENGVLTLNLPKAEVVKPKQIKIAAK